MSQSIRLFLASIVFVAFSICVVSAQNRYSTYKLQQIAESLGIKSEIDSLPDSCYTDTYRHMNHPLSIRIRNGNVEHIGYRMFGKHQRLEQDYIYDFIERHSLESYLGDSLKKFGNRGKKYIDTDDVGMIRSLSNDPDVTVEIKCFYDNSYIVNWLRGERVVFNIVFPANLELISGRTMIENERHLSQTITSYIHPVQPIQKPPSLSSLQPGLYDRSLLMLDSGSPNTTLVGNRLYYNLDADSVPLLVFSPFHPVESVANMLCSSLVDHKFLAKVKLMRYNFKYEYFTMPLYDLIGFFLNEGCTPYFGLIKYDEAAHQIECILEMHNHMLAYEHLLRLKIDIREMASLAGMAEITLTSYIPTTNFRIDGNL